MEPGTLRRLAAGAVLLAAGSAAAAPRDEPLRVAFLGPLSGPLAKSAEESLAGLRASFDGADRKAEITTFDDRDDPKVASEMVGEVLKGKFSALVAASTGLTVDAAAERARHGHVPSIFVGSAPPRPTVEEGDPVLFVGPWPVDQALNLAGFLAIHSDKSGLGLYRDCMEPALVVEDTPRGRELADALARNLGPRQHLSGRVMVAPHGAPAEEELKRLRAARCDRLLLLGEPDLVDRTADAMRAVGWQVPLFCADGMLSRAAASLHDGRVRKANFLYGAAAKAQFKEELPVDQPVRPTPADALAGKAAAPVYSRTRNAWFAGWMLGKGAVKAKRDAGAELLAALREIAYSEAEERGRPLLDETGRTALYQWFSWTMGEKGPEPIKAGYLPTRDLGPMLRMKRSADWDRVEIDEDTQVVWLTFGEKEPRMKSDPARTIEEDLAALGLNTSGYEAEMDPWLLEELEVRTLGKINRLFLKNYDGTFVPGVSFNIHFTFTKPEKLKASRYNTAIIAGEESWDAVKDAPAENAPGGRTAGGRVWIYSRWMRYWTAIKDKALRPKMSREDRQYMDGTYSWGTTWEENLRSDTLRALVDGYSSWFAMTGAHELGHVSGCGHDTESTRSIMNVRDAVGLRDTQACWIPLHVKALETSLGRYGARKR